MPGPSWSSALALTLLAASVPAAAQSIGPTNAALGDPAKCVVMVEDMGDVGFRISDAQAVAESVVAPLKKRVGAQAAFYEGVLKAAQSMKRMLGPTVEGAASQDTQRKHYEACRDASPWRVKATFGAPKKGKVKRHWIEVVCRKKDGDAVTDKLHVEGDSFVLARDELHKAMGTFCMQIPDISMIPIEPTPGDKPAEPPGMSKKEVKPWTPPPPRP
ncbi:MAG: hypothetical protein HYS27_28065 [Deltaproteobacteria bacterium]|nr:hypothetical protein [Deltaproteobacteria bacterium]